VEGDGSAVVAPATPGEPALAWYSPWRLTKEIELDRGLQVCGLLESFAMLTVWAWEDWSKWLLSPRALCHAYLHPWCHNIRPYLVEPWAKLVLRVLEYSVLCFALIALVSFFSALAVRSWARTSVRVGWWALLLAWLVREPVSYLDLAFRHNTILMTIGTTIAFLFTPKYKREAIVLFYASCYFWAGTIKLNWEWMSGSASGFYRLKWFPKELIVPSHMCSPSSGSVFCIRMLISLHVVTSFHWSSWVRGCC